MNLFGWLQGSRNRRPAVVRPQVESLELRQNPVIIANPDVYDTVAGSVLAVPAKNGVLANDFTTSFPGNVLTAVLATGLQPVAKGLPNGTFQNIFGATLDLNPDGSFILTTPSDFPPDITQLTFSYVAVDNAAALPPDKFSAATTVIINVKPADDRLYAVGSGQGSPSVVRVFNARTGLEKFTLEPFPNFTGGVNVAVGDVNGDGRDDIIVGAGVGGGPVVRIYDHNGNDQGAFFAYGTNFRGGVQVAVGDIDGNGDMEIITGAGIGGGPHVRIWNNDLSFITPGTAFGKFGLAGEFFAYESTFRGGVNVAAADIKGIGRDYIVTGSGVGGGPLVRVFDGIGGGLQHQFFAYEPYLRSGVNVAAADFGSGFADILTAPGEGTPIINHFDGRTGALLRSFTAFAVDAPTAGVFQNGPAVNPITGFSGLSGGLIPPAGIPGSLTNSNTSFGTGQAMAGFLGGASIAVAKRGGSQPAILVGSGSGYQARVRIFNAATLAEIENFAPFPNNFLGGVSVGGSA